MIIGLLFLALTSVTNPSRAAEQKLQGVRPPDSNRGPTISANARAEAEVMFGERCATCHGQNGDGKGPAALNLNPKPADFRDPNWQHSVTDEKITKAIVYGGTAVGLSASMWANPDLETQPNVVAALVEHIRKLGIGRNSSKKISKTGSLHSDPKEGTR
jgi:hypothetical protein